MPKKIYATFVLPAPNGCNLDCPFCVIAHRREAKNSKLTHEDYLYFLTDILVYLKIDRFAIQGYEPLLPETWPLTKALLRIAGAFFCETTFVTNGTYLVDHAEEIGGFPGLVDAITVSLDSADPAIHDKLRRVSGTFEKALNGIKAVSRTFRGDLIVNSILFPGKTKYLENMPELLDRLGIREWALSPLINIGSEAHVPHGEQLKESLLKLSDRAEAYGITVFLSDELRQTEGTDLFKEFYVRTLGVEEEVFRLSPDGSCSRGIEVLGTSVGVPNWDTREQPTAFLQRIFADIGVVLEHRSKLAETFASWHAGKVVSTIERR